MDIDRPTLDTLGIKGFSYQDLYDDYRLHELLKEYEEFFKEYDSGSFKSFKEYQSNFGEGKSNPEISEILVAAGRALELFIIHLFKIEGDVAELHARLDNEQLIMRFKKNFVKRGMIRKKDIPQDQSIERLSELEAYYKNLHQSFKNLPWESDEELSLAALIEEMVDATNGKFRENVLKTFEEDIEDKPKLIENAKDTLLKLEEYYFLRRFLHPESVSLWMSSWAPEKLNFENLVEVERPNPDIIEIMRGPAKKVHRRDGFKLTDNRGTMRESMKEIEYCMICHEREKDSCSHGIKEKTGELKVNPLGIKLTGCPLEEKISEMHKLKGSGFSIGALAMITIDNPMCAGTGHRICNDCMKACIFQKQEPVNIPKVETSILTDVLRLPWGFEIYALLTRWNPLKVERPAPLPYNGKKVLVVGLGPAGYTLCNHLLNEGFAVVGAEGLKVEPLKDILQRDIFEPIYDFSKEIEKPLDERVLEGFGGVSEYGITVRWDKNFLTVLHLILERRKAFKILDGVRFGGTITIDDAWDLGFDHIGIAAGAGRPTIISMKNNISRGIRKASDFLMALQLTGAAKKDSMANLQVQLPAIVIGGGLTGTDTATETLAYYPVQVERFAERADVLKAQIGEEAFWQMYDEEELAISRRFYDHGKAIQSERERARAVNEKPNFLPLLNEWGGVTLVYRKMLQDSPAYRLNHEEVIEAMREGIFFAENLSPYEAKLDQYGAVQSVIFEKHQKRGDGRYTDTGEKVELPARSVFVAAGTAPNITYEHEYAGTFELDKRRQYYTAYQAVENINPEIALA
jgi:NADPH-dependent glutamate synthase beta subunit-like oxidoreductase